MSKLNQIKTTIQTLFAFLLAICSLPAFADKPIFGDSFMFSIGGMEQKAKASFRSTRDGRPPITLDLNDLDMDPKTSTVWLGASWQFADRWGVSFGYSGFNSDGLITTEEDGNFGDIEWNASATLESELDLDLYIIDVHWDFLNTERTHVGVGFGLHIADLSTGISGRVEADINGIPVEPPIDLGTDTAAVTAPLPNISLRAGHRFGDSFYLGGTAGYFNLKVGDVDGELVTARAALEWRPGAGAFGLGAGYQYVDINVKEDDGDLSNRYDMEFYGPVLFVSVGF